MKHRGRAAAFCTALCLLLSLFPSAAAAAPEKHQPTLYIADDAWYKDLSAPLIREGETLFLPLEAFAQLPSITLRLDETVGAALLTREGRTLTFDTESGVRILPDGDETLAVRRIDGTLYLPLLPVVSLLGLGFELYTYQSGVTALRINDGSGIFPFSSLIRMYAEEVLPPARTVLPAAETIGQITLFPVSLTELPDGTLSFPRGTVLLFDAQALTELNAEQRITFRGDLLRLLSGGAVPALYTTENDPDTALHYLIQGNQLLLSIAHRGAYLYLSDLELTEEQAEYYAEAGLIWFGKIPDSITQQKLQSTGDDHAGNR